MIKKKILLGFGSAIAIATPTITVVACGSSKKTTTPKTTDSTKKQDVALKNKKQKPVNVVELIALMSSGGIFSLPTYLTENSLSIEAILDELALGESGTLIKGLSAMPNVKLPMDIIEKVLVHKNMILKMIDGGLASLDNNDLNNIKALIRDFVGDKYVGTNKLLDALINGVKNEVVNQDGSINVIPKLIKDLVNDLIKPLVKGNGGGSLSPSLMGTINGAIKQYLDPLSQKLFGTWENFLTSDSGILKNVPDLKFETLSNLKTIKEIETQKLKIINEDLGNSANPYLMSLKLILANHQSAKDNSRKILSSIDYMKTLEEFKGFSNILNMFNLEAGKPLITLSDDNDFAKMIETTKKISDYLSKNWQEIIKDEFIKDGKKVLVGDELKPFFVDNDFVTDNLKAMYPTILINIVSSPKSVLDNLSLYNYDLNNIKYVEKMKKAIKINQSIIGDNLLSVPTLAGKSILKSQTITEFKKTLAYLQSIIQRAIVYIGYEGRENQLRNVLMLTYKATTIPFDVLGSEMLLKLATADLTKPLSSDLLSEKDMQFILNIIPKIFGNELKSVLSPQELKGIFTILIDGFKIKGESMNNFKSALMKILELIPGITKDILPIVSGIVFGNK